MTLFARMMRAVSLVSSGVLGFQILFLICKWVCFIQEILQTRPSQSLLPQEMSFPSAFEMQRYSYAVLSSEECMKTELVWAACNSNSGMEGGYVVHVVKQARNS